MEARFAQQKPPVILASSFLTPEGPEPEGAGAEAAQPSRNAALNRPAGSADRPGTAVVAVALAAWSLLCPAPEPASSDSAPSAGAAGLRHRTCRHLPW